MSVVAGWPRIEKQCGRQTIHAAVFSDTTEKRAATRARRSLGFEKA